MEGHARGKGKCVGTVGEEGPASNSRISYSSRYRLQIEARLRISWIEILRREQAMPLTPYVGHLQHQVLGNFPLNRQVVLFGILRSRILCCLPEQQNGAEHRPIHGFPTRRIQDAVEGIGKGCLAVLAQERGVELRVEHERAAAERRFRAKLFQHQLLHGVIENSVASADAGLASASKQLAQESILGIGTPGHTDSRSKRFVVC